MKFIVCVMAVFIVCASEIFAVECPKQPQQSQKNWDTEVNIAVAKIGLAKGAELKLKTKNAAQDLIGKLPKADRIYLEQMMYATYCSSLRDDKTLTENEKGKRIKAYNSEIRRTFEVSLSKITKKKSILPPKAQISINGGDYVAGNKTVNIASTRTDLEEIVRKVAKELSPSLTKKYQGNYTVFGIERDGFVVPKGLVPEGVDVSWQTGLVKYTDQLIELTIPDIVINTKNIKNVYLSRNVAILPKRVSDTPIKLFAFGNVGIEIQVLGIDKELVVVGLGFPIIK